MTMLNDAAIRHRQRLQEGGLARKLGTTATGLSCLARATANPEGQCKAGGTARGALLKRGLVTGPDSRHHYFITKAGREVVRKARELRW